MISLQRCTSDQIRGVSLAWKTTLPCWWKTSSTRDKMRSWQQRLVDMSGYEWKWWKWVDAFPTYDRAKDIKDLDQSVDELHVQCSFGLSWNVLHTWGCCQLLKALDPLGFCAPLAIQERLLLGRQCMRTGEDGTTFCSPESACLAQLGTTRLIMVLHPCTKKHFVVWSSIPSPAPKVSAWK